MYDRILVPLGGETVGESVLECARLLAELLDAELVLLRAVPPHPATTYVHHEGAPPAARDLVEAERAALASADTYIRDAADRLSGYVRVQALVRRGDVVEEILRAARDFRCSIIAMGTHGHGSLRRMVGGSITDQVVRRSPVPVLMRCTRRSGTAAAALPELQGVSGRGGT